MLKTHKITLQPNNIQKTYFINACGVARFAYNWALTEWQLQYDFHKQFPWLIDAPNQYELCRELNSIKHTQFPWMVKVTKCAPQEAIINLGSAFKNFFNGKAKYPTFKKRGHHDSFKLSAGTFDTVTKNNRSFLKVPKLGLVRLKENLRFRGKLVSATISRTANRWFVAITVDTSDIKPLPRTNNTIGIDVGVRAFADSDGNSYFLPRVLQQKHKQLKRLQQALFRKKKGGKNRNKTRMRLARLYYKIMCVRQDFLYKLSFKIINENQVIALEDLNIKGMLKNHRLAKSISDASFGEFKRQINYKATIYGREVITIDQWYPSSKLCHACGYKATKMPLNIRCWCCPECGMLHDRDLNAAINLKNYTVSSTVSAYGQFLTTE